MNKEEFKQTLETVKDLILFDSKWEKRSKSKEANKIPKKAIERIKVYRDLVHNSFYELITKIYPFTKELLKKDWKKLISEYIEECPPRSPILNKVAEPFPQFISRKKKLLSKYPFIAELALYEWLELDVSDKEYDLVHNKGSLNPANEICRFSFPIPEIIDLIKRKKSVSNIGPKSTCILIYRDPKTFDSRFFELSEGALGYVELLKTGLMHEMIVLGMSDFYKISAKDFSKFEKNISMLVKELKKNRIIV